MTNHYDEMRVSPDPAQAEELRQRLHARMANISTDDPRRRSALELDSDGDPDEWIVPMNELSAPDTSTTNQRTRRRVWVAAAAILVVAIAAAGIAIRRDDPSPVGTTAPTSTTPTSAGSSNKRCPLTAEEVSTVIGHTVTRETLTAPYDSCQFGRGFPKVRFAYQSASACTHESLRAAGYLVPPDDVGGAAPVDGFGVDAYARRVSLGHIFIVCDGDQPFELLVDGVQGDVPVAIALATLVRNG
jgi:hypothetical protein